MARYQCPSTPFSTPLSGSARQAEARIRNLFQGPKRRPPVWLMVLVLLLILSCGCLLYTSLFTSNVVYYYKLQK